MRTTQVQRMAAAAAVALGLAVSGLGAAGAGSAQAAELAQRGGTNGSQIEFSRPRRQRTGRRVDDYQPDPPHGYERQRRHQWPGHRRAEPETGQRRPGWRQRQRSRRQPADAESEQQRAERQRQQRNNGQNGANGANGGQGQGGGNNGTNNNRNGSNGVANGGGSGNGGNHKASTRRNGGSHHRHGSSCGARSNYVVRETYHYVPYFVNVPVVHHVYSGPYFDYDYDWYYYRHILFPDRYVVFGWDRYWSVVATTTSSMKPSTASSPSPMIQWGFSTWALEMC